MTLSVYKRFQIAAVLFFANTLYLLEWFTTGIFKIGFTIFLASAILITYKIGKLPQTNYLVNHYVDSNFYSYNSKFELGKNVLGLTNVKSEFPKKIADNPLPEITAKSVYIADKNNNNVLLERNPTSIYASASTTKLMTALVALDVYQGTDKVKVLKDCTELESTKIGFPENSEYKAYDLIKAMLVSSAGDAACALAEGKILPGEFVYRMNQKAYQIGLTSTLFTNAVGLDSDTNSHFSSAKDLFKLAQVAVSKPIIAEAARTKELYIKSVDEGFIGKTQNTNKLLWEIPQTVGVKTGTTTNALEVFIYEYKDEVKDFIIVVMGSEDRFSDTRALVSWVLTNFTWN